MYLLRTSIPMSRMSSAAASPLAVSEWVRSHTETMSMIYHAKYDKKKCTKKYLKQSGVLYDKNCKSKHATGSGMTFFESGFYVKHSEFYPSQEKKLKNIIQWCSPVWQSKIYKYKID
jgi:hypothetical protein